MTKTVKEYKETIPKLFNLVVRLRDKKHKNFKHQFGFLHGYIIAGNHLGILNSNETNEHLDYLFQNYK
jgi:hypothetical protein